MTHITEKLKLKQSVGLTSVVMLGTGTAIGVSIFSVLAPAAKIAGSGLLFSIFIASIPMLAFAAVYAFISSINPVSGASYEWPKTYISPFAGFIISWLRILTNVGAITVLGTVLVNYISSVIYLPTKPTLALIFTFVFALNYKGVSVAAKLQSFLMIALLAILSLFFITGLSYVEITNYSIDENIGIYGMFMAVPLLITLFLGIESSVEIGGEVVKPHRNIPIGIGLAILLTALIYFLVSFVALGVLGPVDLANSNAPIFDAAKVVLGKWAIPIVIGAAIIAILTTMNSIALIFSRALFAMGRSGTLPKVLGNIHEKNGTPHNAIALAYFLAMLGILLPSNITFLLLAVNIPTMLKYLATSICVLRIEKHHPELIKQSHLNIKPENLKRISYIACLFAALIIVMGISSDWRAYILVLIWLLVGILFWFFTKSNNKKVVETQSYKEV